MENIEEVFEYVKFAKFLEGFTDIGVNSGIRHRIAGNGTNKTDKVKGLTDKDKEGIKTGLQQFINQVQKVIDKN